MIKNKNIIIIVDSIGGRVSYFLITQKEDILTKDMLLDKYYSGKERTEADELILSPMNIDIKAGDITCKKVIVKYENGKEKVIMDDGLKICSQIEENAQKSIKIRWRQKIDMDKVVIDDKEFCSKR